MSRQCMKCPNCSTKLYELSEYKFLDVQEDFAGRDVIEFKCYNCGKVGESFVYIERGTE